MSLVLDGSSGTTGNLANGDLQVNGVTVGKGGGTISTNTAVGASALNANTTGANNAAFGYQALYSNTASNNIALGYQASYSNTSGTQNCMVGWSAGYYSTGSNNTYIGNLSGPNNATGSGSYNTALGYQALQANTTGSNNVAVGYQAGYSNTTSIQNAFFGYQAGYSSTGGNNTFIGQGAGYYVTSGAKNTILGEYTGNQGGLDIRTGNNYTILSDGDGNRTITSAASSTVALQGASISSGTGISFPATQSASSDANTLDDYEEGTFTLTVTPNGGSLTSYSNYGYYVKIGRHVTITCAFAILNSGTASGTATFGGLPFTTLNPSGLIYGGNRAGTSSWREDAATGNWYFGYLNPNATSGVLSTSTNGGITWTTGYAYVTSFVYETAS